MSLAIPKNISWKNLDLGIVLLNLENGVYYTLNETASLIFQCIIDGCDEQKIVSAVIKEYDCDEGQITQDVHEQISYLFNEGLIERSEKK